MTVEEVPLEFKKFVNEPSGNAHRTDSTNQKPKFKSGGLNKKTRKDNPCPKGLQSRPGCQTEQKFAHDLIKWNKKSKGGAKDEKFRLKGQFPPCPNCHAALMRAAQETGAKIEYEWGGNRITYGGSSKRKSESEKSKKDRGKKGVDVDFEGTEAGALEPTYSQHELKLMDEISTHRRKSRQRTRTFPTGA